MRYILGQGSRTHKLVVHLNYLWSVWLQGDSLVTVRDIFTPYLRKQQALLLVYPSLCPFLLPAICQTLGHSLTAWLVIIWYGNTLFCFYAFESANEWEVWRQDPGALFPPSHFFNVSFSAVTSFLKLVLTPH